MTSSINPVRRMDITISMRPDSGLEKQTMISRFYKFCQENTDMFVFQHELTGSDNHHIQGRVSRKSRIRTISFAHKISAETGIPVSYIHVSPTQRPNQNFDYTMKSETRFSGPYSNMDLDALQVVDPLVETQLYDWQNFILNEWFDNQKKREYNKSGRKILFVHDSKGNTGKSTLCKHCAISRQKDVCLLPVSGTANQLASAILDAGSYSNYILDLPRCKPSEDGKWIQDILFVIEQLANGLIVNSMYGKYKRLVMNNPQIVVFSNWRVPEYLSQDRYIYIDPSRFNVSDVPGSLDRKMSNLMLPSRIGAQDVY
jgi:hypothetical protein